MATLAQPAVLHVAAMWGTTVLTLRHLARGESFDEDEFAMPDDLEMSSSPVRASGDSWEIDPRGVIAGKLRLRGRDEDMAALAKVGMPFSIMKGDFGLMQYGQFGLFFQCAERPSLPAPERTREALALLALLSSTSLHMGALGLLRALTTPAPIAKPLELASPDDFTRRFGLKRPVLVPPQLDHDDSTTNAGESSPQKTEGEKSAGPAGKIGNHGAAPLSRSPRPLGDVGDEIEKTLGSLPTVEGALALAGPQLVVGGGHGPSLHGIHSGGDGVNPHSFGQNDIASPWGVPRGGDYGHGERETAATTPRVGVVITDRDRPRTLDPEQVRRVVVYHQGALRACYDTELTRNSNARGGLTVSWTIEPGGTVTSASVVSSTISPRVEGCVVRQVKSWRFPRSEAPTQVAAYPFKFGIGG